MQVEFWQIAVLVAVVCAAAGLYGVLSARGVIKRLQTQIAADSRPEPAPTVSDDRSATIGALSERISALEGQVPNLRAGIDGFAALAQRVTAVEAHMPGLQDAYETYADSLNRKDKRDTERERRAGKTAGETAAELVGAPHQLNGPGVSASAPAPLPTVALGTRRGRK